MGELSGDRSRFANRGGFQEPDALAENGSSNVPERVGGEEKGAVDETGEELGGSGFQEAIPHPQPQSESNRCDYKLIIPWVTK